MKSPEVLLAEAKEQIASLTKENTELKEANKEIVTLRKAAAQSEIAKLIGESKLPEAAKKHITSKFAEADKVDGVKAEIDAFTESLKEATTVKKNNGVEDNKQLTESDSATLRAATKKTFMESGVSEKEAEILAGL